MTHPLHVENVLGLVFLLRLLVLLLGRAVLVVLILVGMLLARCVRVLPGSVWILARGVRVLSGRVLVLSRSVRVLARGVRGMLVLPGGVLV